MAPFEWKFVEPPREEYDWWSLNGFAGEVATDPGIPADYLLDYDEHRAIGHIW